MEAVRTLLQLHVTLLLRGFGPSSGRPSTTLKSASRQLYIAAIILILGFVAYSTASSWVASQGQVAHEVALALLLPILTSLASAATVLIFFYAFTQLIGTFTERGELRLLLLSPASPYLIVAERLLVTSLGFSGILLVGLPALYALGTGLHAGADYYVAAALAVLLAPLMPVSFASLVLVALLRWLPPARARTISTFVGTAIGFLFFIASQLLIRGSNRSFPQLPDWLPTTWPGRLLSDAGLGRPGDALRYGLLTALLAILSYVVATALAARVFATGSASYSEVRRSRRKAQAPATLVRGAVVRASSASLPRSERGPGWWPILTKEWLMLRRDPQRLVTLLYPLFIIGFNVYQLVSRNASEGHGHSYLLGVSLPLLVIACLLMVSSSAPSIVNREGRALTLLALSPVSSTGIITAKWIAAVVPALIIIEASLVGLGVYLAFPPGDTVVCALALGLLAVALTGVALAVNLAWPKLDSTNPRRQSSGIASIVGMVLEIVVSLFTGVLLVAGLLVWHGWQSAISVAILFLGLVAVFAVSARLSPRLLQRLMQGEPGISGISLL